VEVTAIEGLLLHVRPGAIGSPQTERAPAPSAGLA